MLLTLPDELLELLVRSVLVARRRGPGEVDRAGTVVPCFDDTVFLALVCHRLASLVRAGVASLVGEALRTQLYDPPSWPAAQPRLVTSLAGLFCSHARFVFTYKHLLGLAPAQKVAAPSTAPAWAPTALVFKQKWDVDMTDMRAYPSVPPERVHETIALAAPLMTTAGLIALVRNAPVEMVCNSFWNLFCPNSSPLALSWTAGNPQHRLLLTTAARYGRLDVLKRLVHTQPLLQSSYDSRRGILDMILSEDNVVRARTKAGPIFINILLPAVLGDRADVLAWLREMNDDLRKRGVWRAKREYDEERARLNGRRPHSGLETGPFAETFETRAGVAPDESTANASAVCWDALAALGLGRETFGSTWYRSRDFTSLAALAVRCGSVKVLDWLYDNVRADKCKAASGAPDAPLDTLFDIHLRTYRVALIALAFSGTLVPPKGEHCSHSEGSQRRGVCARWAQRKWEEEAAQQWAAFYAKDLLGFLEAYVALRTPLAPSRTAPMAAERTAVRNWGSARSLPAQLYLTAEDGIGTLNAIVSTVGDEDRCQWMIDESRPGGFLASLFETHPEDVHRRTMRSQTVHTGGQLRPVWSWPAHFLSPQNRLRWFEMFARAVPTRTRAQGNYGPYRTVARWEFDFDARIQGASLVYGYATVGDEVLGHFGRDSIDRPPSCVDWLPLAIPNQMMQQTAVGRGGSQVRTEATSVERGYGLLLAEYARGMVEHVADPAVRGGAGDEACPSFAHAAATALETVRMRIFQSYTRMWAGPVLDAMRRAQPWVDDLVLRAEAATPPFHHPKMVGAARALRDSVHGAIVECHSAGERPDGLAPDAPWPPRVCG